MPPDEPAPTVPPVAVQTLRPSAAKAMGPPPVEMDPVVASVRTLILVSVDERRLATQRAPGEHQGVRGATDGDGGNHGVGQGVDP